MTQKKRSKIILAVACVLCLMISMFSSEIFAGSDEGSPDGGPVVTAQADSADDEQTETAAGSAGAEDSDEQTDGDTQAPAADEQTAEAAQDGAAEEQTAEEAQTAAADEHTDITAQARAVLKSRGSTELTNIISNVKLWDVNEGGYVPLSGGSYQMVQGNPYRFEVDFDLTPYNGNLENGDYFTFTVPEPFSVADGTITLTHQETAIAIGLAEVISNGEGNGGLVRVTLQNLDEYLAQTGGTEVRDIKGTFYVNFSVSEIVTNETVTYSALETLGVITHVITVKEKGGNDYSQTIGKSNFNKFGGVLTERPYVSEALGKSGTYVHPWYVRTNVRQASYDTITIYDSVSNDHAPMQFIPETLKISYGYYDSGYSFDYEGYLEEGTDYTITYNSSYTSFEINIPNASSRIAENGRPAAYQLSYDTTAPADGSTVANTVSVSGDEQPLTVNTETTQTSTTITRISKITQGGTITIDVAYRIVLYKIDSSTGSMLAGAVFKIVTPGGEEIILPPTDENGRTYSRTFTSQEAAEGDFTIIEMQAPDGFEPLDEPVTVTVGSEGAIKTISNTPKKTSIKVNKIWNDEDDQDGIRPQSVTVKLLADGADTGKTLELSLENGWTAEFTDLDEYQNGRKIVYMVEEADVSGYSYEISGDAEIGYTVTNSHESEVTEIGGTKIWEDNDNQDGSRPESITIRLMKDDTEIDSVTVGEADGWSWRFTDLPKYENKGTEIIYSIEEDPVDGYETTIEGNAEDGFRVINTKTPTPPEPPTEPPTDPPTEPPTEPKTTPPPSQPTKAPVQKTITPKTSPKTGDESTMLIYVLMILLSGSVITGFAAKTKRKI